ncbi:ISAs1 family transposase [Halomonas sp. JS92-SW72]|uniref:ISAs1 family transposase n=1 Tax=Halomonas sp. JS92-SW72 TaxID=2306583 RepID=UPI0023E27572|nr:ISAs1 family transposase [Halomonas sp. JS92-SW72]
MLTPSLMHHLSIVPDFRQAWKVQHQLSDILFLTVCAVICGAEGWDEIEDFGHAKLDFLRQYGDFEAGVPSHDTLARVMALVNAEQLQSAFAEWMKACHDVTEGAVVAIDGKTLRGSYCRGKGKGAIHMVSAFSAANGVVLGQVKTAEKSNEITAIPELLKLLNLQGCLVTIDAMGCQKKIATQILQKGADYLLVEGCGRCRRRQLHRAHRHPAGRAEQLREGARAQDRRAPAPAHLRHLQDQGCG